MDGEGDGASTDAKVGGPSSGNNHERISRSQAKGERDGTGIGMMVSEFRAAVKWYQT